MDKRKTLLLSVICAIAVLCAGIAGLLYMSEKESGTTYVKQIQAADKYYAQGDYENAIIAYKAAIREDEKAEEPYQRLTMIYLAQNEMTLAKSTLELGISNTSSAKLEKMWKDYFGEMVETAGDEKTGEEKEKEIKVTVNRTLLSEISEAVYSDYRLKYGEPSIHRDGQTYKATYGSTGISYLYYNTAEDDGIIDKAVEQPYGEAMPNEVSFQELTLLFPGMSERLDYSTLSQLDLQNLTKSYDREAKRYVVSFLCGGCNISVESDEEGNILSPDAWNKVVPLQRKKAAEVFTVDGRVIDATTGEGVAGAVINIRSEGDQTGEILADAATDSDGSYTAELVSGNYLAEVKLEGYTTEYFELYVDSAGGTGETQFVISPTVENGQIRIVLEWGSAPSDLDSYLEGTLSDGTAVSINFRKKTLEKNGEAIVTLDVDDQDGYGPETTTINDSGGTYHFYVTDYHHEGTLGINGATVKVYMPGDASPTVIQAPADVENAWNVLNIDHGVLTVNNSKMGG